MRGQRVLNLVHQGLVRKQKERQPQFPEEDEVSQPLSEEGWREGSKASEKTPPGRERRLPQDRGIQRKNA